MKDLRFDECGGLRKEVLDAILSTTARVDADPDGTVTVHIATPHAVRVYVNGNELKGEGAHGDRSS